MREKRPTPFCCDIKPKTHPFSLEQISNVCFLRRSEQKKGKSESEGRKGEVIRSCRILSLCNCIFLFVIFFCLSFFFLSSQKYKRKRSLASFCHCLCCFISLERLEEERRGGIHRQREDASPLASRFAVAENEEKRRNAETRFQFFFGVRICAPPFSLE